MSSASGPGSSASKWNVLCIMPDELFKALAWQVDQDEHYSSKINLEHARLGDLANRNSRSDFSLLCLDLGQPFPKENLGDLLVRPGMCALAQPTPKQLIEIAAIPNWSACVWDSSNFEDLLSELLSRSHEAQQRARELDFLEGARFWMKKEEELPRILEWKNPPERWEGPTRFLLDRHLGIVSIGAVSSKATVKLPEAGSAEWLHLHFEAGKWVPRVINESLAFSRREGEGGPLVGRSTFRLGDYELEALPSEAYQDLYRIAGVSLSQTSQGLDFESSQINGFLDLFKELMLSGVSGELRMKEGHKTAVCYFSRGILDQALCGAVVGRKALLRTFSWADFQWSFNPGKDSGLQIAPMHMSFFDVRRIYDNWASKWGQVGNAMPPAHLRLRLSPGGFKAKQKWVPEEYKVAASICEYERVQEVFNNCPLDDVDILSRLIGFRKAKLIEVGS